MSLRKWLKVAGALRPLEPPEERLLDRGAIVQTAPRQRRHKYDFSRHEPPITKAQQVWILGQQQKQVEAGIRAPAIRDADLSPEQLAELNALRGEMDQHDKEYTDDDSTDDRE
ncbi:MAG TPA: hypothetical protein VHU77_11370 [Candidatus Limnocylindria bacterium]|jgi:hypothetical protein|nr:hypothetical protein [Candidatus Limnocylindria bacterium]